MGLVNVQTVLSADTDITNVYAGSADQDGFRTSMEKYCTKKGKKGEKTTRDSLMRHRLLRLVEEAKERGIL